MLHPTFPTAPSFLVLLKLPYSLLVTEITDIVRWFSDNPRPSRDGYFVIHTRVIVTHYGGPDALHVIEEECPQPHAGEIRAKVLAAGVSLPDVLAREGIHPETPRVPYTPGWDLFGVVDEINKRDVRFRTGPDGCSYADQRLLRTIYLPAKTQVHSSARGIGSCRSRRGRLELRYGLPDAASFGEGKAGTTRADSRCLRRRRHGIAAIGAARRRGNVRNVFGAGPRT